MPSTAGSRILETHYPPFNSHVVSALKASGAIILGKTNLDEFGMGSTTETSAYRATRNPWEHRRVPGGSSGGSAAAVAQHQCIAALGSDTGGSIRQPASFCGVVGLKPTFGLLSRHGLMSYASSFDCICPVTSSVQDAAIVLSAMSEPSQQIDSTLQKQKSSAYHEHLLDIEHMTTQPLRGRRFAIIKETIGPGVEISVVERILTAASDIEDLGGIVDVVSCPTFNLGLPAYYILALSEASSNLARYDNVRFGDSELSRSEGMGAEVKRRILMGSYALSAGHSDAYYKRAQEVRSLVEADLSTKLKTYDVLLTPAAPTPAFRANEKKDHPLAMFSGDMMTVNINLCGLPAIVVRGGKVLVEDKLLPVGLQFIGRPFGEVSLLETAHIFEICTWKN